MRAVAFVLILALAGYVSSAHFAWKTGKQYNYGVRARLFTGPSDINTQYSGLSIFYKIVLTVTGPNTIHLKPENVKAVELNGELNGGWREAELENEGPAQIPANLLKYLESPVELQMNQGLVESIKVDNYLPTWAVNIKKAQASYFVANTAGVNSVVRGNLNRQTNSVRPEEANEESGYFYETMEETIHGECETYYTVSQNGPFDWPNQFQKHAQPDQHQHHQQQQQNSGQNESRENNNDSNDHNSNESNQQNDQQNDNDSQQNQDSSEERQRQLSWRLAQRATFNRFGRLGESSENQNSHEDQNDQANHEELPWPKEFAIFCEPNHQVYEIVKTVNFTACKNKPVLGYTSSPGVYGHAGDNSIGSALTRALITRYLACGQDRKQYTILKIEQEEQVNTGIRLDQRTVAGTIQNITLLSVEQALPVQQILHSKTIKGLSYTFDPKEQELQRQGKINNAYSDDLEENDDQSSSQEWSSSTTERYNQYQGHDQDQSESNEDDENQSGNNDDNNRGGRYAKFSSWRSSKSRKPRSVQSSEESQEQSGQNQSRKEQAYKTDAENSGPLPKPSLRNPPVNAMLVSPLQSSGMQKRIVTLMEEIKKDILSDEKSMAESETLSKISTVAKIIRQLKYTEIWELYEQLAAKTQTEEHQTSRNVFQDAMAIAGTNPSIVVLVDLMKSGKIQGEEAAQLIMSFPLYIRTPTKELVQYIFENLVNAPQIQNHLQAKTTALLAFTNLVYQAFVDGKIKNSRYPVALYGEFGNQKDVQQRYAQYFLKNLKQALQKDQSEGNNKHYTITYLKALGNLGTQEIIQAVQKIMDDEDDAYIKTNAILALSRAIISRSSQNVENQAVDRQGHDSLTYDVIEQQVLPILVSAAFDKGEHPETRMAAISLLLYTTNAHLAIWQQLATSTWFESSQEVHSFIFSSFKSLVNAEQSGASGAMYTAIQKARAVLALTKPITPGMTKSRNTFHAGFASHLQSAYSHQFSYFGSKDSNVPNYIYYRNQVQYANNGFGVTPLQVTAYGHTIQKLASYAFAKYQQQRQEARGSNEQSHESSEHQEAHKYLEQIHQVLGIERRDQEENIEGSLDFKIRNEMQRFFSINEEDIERYFRQVKQTGLAKLLATGYQINYQKTFHAAEHVFEMPTGFGVPVTFKYQLPVHVSLRGSAKLAVEGGFQNTQLQLELHPVYAYKTHTRLSFKVPFTGKQYDAGIQRHFVVEAPFRALVQVAPGGQIILAVTPSQLTQGQPSGKIPLATFHQVPYTAIITDSLWPVTHKEGGQVSIVHAAGIKNEEETPKRQMVFGQKALGLTFETEEEYEGPEQNQGKSGWIQFWRKFHSQTCVFNLGWLGGENVRYVQRTLTLDVSQSETKTLVLTFGGKRQVSASAKDLWQDSSSASSQSTEESASSESSKDSSSQQQDSKSNEQDEENKSQTGWQRRDGSGSASGATHSAEDLSQEGMIVAGALIGKRTPIRPVQEGQSSVQNILHHGSPSTVQYLVQVSKSSGRFYFRAATGDAANEAAKALPQGARSLQGIRDAIVKSANTKEQPDSCVEFEGEYDAPKWANRGELFVLRKRLLAEDLVVKVKAELQFGRSCKNMPHEIKVQGKLERGPQMTQYAKYQSRQAQKCAEDEKKGFNVSPVCVEVAVHQAAALNRGDLKITFTQMPNQFVNRTDDLEDLAKAVLYPYVQTDRFHEGVGDNKMRVQFNLTPNKKYLDVEITKPHSKLSFKSIRTNRAIRTFLPFTATQSLANNIRDRTLRADSDPSCQLESNFVNTFDNVTYRFSEQAAQNCYHVLAQDCSGRQQMAVLVKDVASNQKKVVILLESQTRIELIPQKGSERQGLLGQGKLQVKINDQNVETLPRVIRCKQSGHIIARIEYMNEGGVQVFSKHVDVATNAKYVVVYASNNLRNRTCGLCGDFNGEKTADLKSPQGFPLSSGSLLVASYAIQPKSLNDKNGGECKVNAQLRRQLANEKSQYQQHGSSDKLSQEKDALRDEGQNQSGESGTCIEESAMATRRIVFRMVDHILKPFAMAETLRHRIANRVADKAIEEMRKIMMESKMSAFKIAKAVTRTVCQTLEEPEFLLRSPKVLCFLMKPFMIAGITHALNPICKHSQCCTPSYFRLFNMSQNQIESDLEYAMADDAESDKYEENDSKKIAFLGASDKDLPCQAKLEKQLPMSVSKIVYMAAQSNPQLSSSYRRQLSKRVYDEVREAISKAVKSGEEFATCVIDAVERAAPNVDNNLIRPVLHDITKFSIQGLEEKTNCNFKNNQSKED